MVFTVSSAGQKPSSVWERLRNHEAWVFLGDLDLPTNAWGTNQNHEVANRKVDASSFVPVVGDTLRFTIDVQLVLMSFATRREANARTSPVGRRLGNTFERMGKSFAPNGLSIGSSRMAGQNVGVTQVG